LRLPDGRILLIHNNNNIGRKREPLSFWLSDDEMKSWYIKADVLYGGMLAYPHAVVLKDGRVVFVYDHNRRQIRFVEIELPPKRQK
ncbi:MAG: sialidase family protein, partial [Sedimentisphaerales bacterium]